MLIKVGCKTFMVIRVTVFSFFFISHPHSLLFCRCLYGFVSEWLTHVYVVYSARKPQ